MNLEHLSFLFDFLSKILINDMPLTGKKTGYDVDMKQCISLKKYNTSEKSEWASGGNRTHVFSLSEQLL